MRFDIRQNAYHYSINGIVICARQRQAGHERRFEVHIAAIEALDLN
jgi:hypothetical protein